MKFRFVFFILLMAAVSFGEEKAPQVTVLKAARIWDGRSANAVQNGAVIIENGKIRSVGAGETPANANVIDLGDVTLLPGFIDMHVHTTSQIGANYIQTFWDELRSGTPEDSLRASFYAKKMLDAGFTTIRNLGANERIDAG